MQDHSLLIFVLLTFIALGLLYNVSLPLFEAPDEMDHFRYANWLATERNLPNMRTDLQIIGHEVGQPPLYYAILAPFVAGIDTHDLEHVAPPNPYWRQERESMRTTTRLPSDSRTTIQVWPCTWLGSSLL